jgi:general secretion pathway protein M
MGNPEQQMSLKTTLNRSLQPVSEFWAARNARERRIILVALSVALLAFIYSLLIEPAISGRERLAKDLPRMRQQVAQLQALAREASALPKAEASPSEPISKESLEAALKRKGLKAENVTFTGEIARVQLTAVPFPALLEWLLEMQKTALLSVLEASIPAQSQPGMVNATLTLRQQKSE